MKVVIGEKENWLKSYSISCKLVTDQRLRLELDMRTIGKKVSDLEDTAQELVQTYPDQEKSIFEHHEELNKQWNAFSKELSKRRAEVLDNLDLESFLGDFR